MQTYSCSCVFVKKRQTLLNTYTEHPEYLADVLTSEHSDPWDLGPEMSHPHRTIKLWYTIQALGTDKLADIIDYSFYNSIVAEKSLKEKENWQILSKPMCATINFRYAPEGKSEQELNELNGKISEAINKDGFAYIVTTTNKGKRVLRMCCINGNTTTEDVTATIGYLDKIARSLIS